MIRCIHDDLKSSCFLYLLWHNQFEYYHNHIMYCTENARSWKNLRSTCTQRWWYAVFTMIWSRPVSCTYCDIINLSITTITLCIAQKMQEAERIFNHHVYNVSATRCIHDDLKSSCFLYLLCTVSSESSMVAHCLQLRFTRIWPGMGFPTMWYVLPAKPQISLRISAVWSEPLLVAWIFYECYATDLTSFWVSKLKRRLHRFVVWVYTCQNASLLGITCQGSIINISKQWIPVYASGKLNCSCLKTI